MELKYKKLISKELNELENNLRSSVSSEIELATEVSSYLVNSGGKRIRPAICILVAKAFDYSGNDLIRLASSIELLHTATLIHDDVVDESLMRRGKEVSYGGSSIISISILSGIILNLTKRKINQ